MGICYLARAVTLASATALSLMSCGGVPPPRPDQITRIVISVSGCAMPCFDAYQIGMFPDGHFTFTGPNPSEYRGRIDWPDMVRRLLATRFFSGRTDYTTTRNQLQIVRRNLPPTATLYVGYAGTARAVDIDYGGDDVADIRDYERYVADTVYKAVGHLRLAQEIRLGDFSSIQSIVLERGGGFGGVACCGRFRISVLRSGTANVWYCGDYSALTQQGKCVSAKGRVDFRRALTILRDSRYTRFEPHYANWGADMTTARLIVRYRRFTYSVDAPDMNHWPPGLTEVVFRFQQLIEDSSWSPSLPRD